MDQMYIPIAGLAFTVVLSLAFSVITWSVQGYVDLETRGNTLMVAGSPKYAEVIEATAKRFKDRPERERRRSPSPRSDAQHRSDCNLHLIGSTIILHEHMLYP